MKRSSVTLLILVLSLSAVFAGCTTRRDVQTGQVLPANDQRYDFEQVTERAAYLQPGMSKGQVLILLGSPARRDNDLWVYVPERPALLIPAAAMNVRFQSNRYVEHNFSPIVLGERIADQ